MFKFEWEDLFPSWFSRKKNYNSVIEEVVKDKLKDTKMTTKSYEEGNKVVTERTYEGNGFSYSETVVEYKASETDLKIYQLEGELEKAVNKEDYTKAAEIKKEIDQIKQTTKETNKNDK